MSRRQLKTDDEEGFIRAYRDEVWDIEEVYGVQVTCVVTINRARPGIKLELKAWQDAREPEDRLYAVAEYLYPSHSASRLHAALYAASIRLGVEVSRQHQRETGKVSPLASDATRKG